MSTITVPHPSRLAGPARRHWLAAASLRIIRQLAIVLLGCALATHPLTSTEASDLATPALIILAASIAATAWLRWDAWTEVPGAHSREPRVRESWPDWVVTIGLDLVAFAAGLWLAEQDLAWSAQVAVAMLGSGLVIAGSWRVGQAVWRRSWGWALARCLMLLAVGVSLSMAAGGPALVAVRGTVWWIALMVGVLWPAVRMTLRKAPR